MRISSEERRHIVESVAAIDRDATAYLFGSRVDDRQAGGDIDLLILSRRMTPHDRRRLRIKLYDLIGEQKIDILLARSMQDPFVRYARRTGVQL